MLVIEERDDEGVLDAVSQRVPVADGQVIAGDQEIAQDRPGARAIDQDVAGLQQRDRLLGRDLAHDALHRPRAAGLDEVAEGALDRVQRDEPTRPLLQQAPQVRGDGAPVGQPRLELERLEDRLDALPVDRVGLVALDRVRDEVLGE